VIASQRRGQGFRRKRRRRRKQNSHGGWVFASVVSKGLPGLPGGFSAAAEESCSKWRAGWKRSGPALVFEALLKLVAVRQPVKNIVGHITPGRKPRRTDIHNGYAPKLWHARSGDEIFKKTDFRD
jgi:hypothetical protein